MRQSLFAALVLSLALGLSACRQPPRTDGLPNIAGESGNCIPEPPPTYCSWLTTGDVTVHGVVESIALIDDAWWQTPQNDDVVAPLLASCDNPGGWGVRIVLAVEDVLFGEVQRGDVLEFGIGFSATKKWSPGVRQAANGQIEWTATENSIVPGQRLGLTGAYMSDGSLGTRGEYLFLRSGGHLFFQTPTNAGENCDFRAPPAPDETGGVKMQQSCVVGEGDSRRALLAHSNDFPPDNFASKCITAPEAVESECLRTIDCDIGAHCIEGVCTPEGPVD